MSKKTKRSNNENVEQPNPPAHSVDRVEGNARPDFKEVARLAYSYWEARGRDGGSPEEDWFKAENELKMRATPGGVAQ